MGWLQDWKAEKSKHERIYAEFGQYAQTEGFCWACGRTNRDRPRDFFAPWLIHRAHITNKPRLKDRRVVVLLCPLCHANFDNGPAEIRLERGHAIYLKIKFDPDFFDRDMLDKTNLGTLPEAKEPPLWFSKQFQERNGGQFLRSITA